MSMPDEDRGAAGPQDDAQQVSQPAMEEEASVPDMADAASLQRELQKQKDLAKHNLDQWKRTAADLENYRKRVDRERAELLKLSNSALIARLLPILDDFERAFATLPESFVHLTWTEGLMLLERKLRLVLEQHGLKEIEAMGKAFDPLLHQAVQHKQTDAHPSGQVIAVLQRGYRLHDRVLRPAMVTVAQNTDDSKATGLQEGQGVERGETGEKGS